MDKQNLEIGLEKVDKWNALDKGYIPSDLEDIPDKYCIIAKKDSKMQLRREVLRSFTQMLDKAYEDNISLKCVSAFRPYEYQKIIYEKTILQNGKEQNSVAKPGHSEHQLGTVVDISSVEIDYALSLDFANTLSYRWLLDYIYVFGFDFSYTKENHKSKGYIWEPWHLRYLGKTAL